MAVLGLDEAGESQSGEGLFDAASILEEDVGGGAHALPQTGLLHLRAGGVVEGGAGAGEGAVFTLEQRDHLDAGGVLVGGAVKVDEEVGLGAADDLDTIGLVEEEVLNLMVGEEEGEILLGDVDLPGGGNAVGVGGLEDGNLHLLSERAGDRLPREGAAS